MLKIMISQAPTGVERKTIEKKDSKEEKRKKKKNEENKSLS